MARPKLDIAKSVTHTIEAPAISKAEKELAKEKLNAFIKEETRLVKGIFNFFECPGGSTKIVVRKYPGIQAFEKTMYDGGQYEIPLYVARHLNGIDATATAINGKINSCAYPVHGFFMNSKDDTLKPSMLGEGGAPVPVVGVQRWTRRFGFQSLEFAGAVA